MTKFVRVGDVFVGQWGPHKRINLIIRFNLDSALVRFIRQTGTEETTWHMYRDTYGNNWKGKSFMRFVGNVPEGWREEVINLMKNGRP